jgi:hypothetical protein
MAASKNEVARVDGELAASARPLAMRIVVSAVAAVLLATSAQAAHHKIRRHPAQPYGQAVQKPKPKPAVDPLYDSCENPWKHLDVQCPGHDPLLGPPGPTGGLVR